MNATLLSALIAAAASLVVGVVAAVAAKVNAGNVQRLQLEVDRQKLLLEHELAD